MPTKDTTHLRLRIEARLLQRLEKAREKTGRTLTGEIVDRIERTFAKDDTIEAIKTSAAPAFREGLRGVTLMLREVEGGYELVPLEQHVPDPKDYMEEPKGTRQPTPNVGGTAGKKPGRNL